MQRNDANDVKQHVASCRRDPSGQSAEQDAVQHYLLTGQLQAITGRQTAPGLLPPASTGSASASVVTPVISSSTPLQHQTVVVASQDLERIFTTPGSSGTVTGATPTLSAQTRQRQLSSQGIVGVISPGSSCPTGGPTDLIRQGAMPTGPELQIPPTLTLVTATTPSGAPGQGTIGGAVGQGTLSARGATVHHHGRSPSRVGLPTPRTNLQQHSLNMSIQPTGQQHSPNSILTTGVSAPASASSLAVTMAGKVLQETKPSITPMGLTHTFPNLTALANQSAMGPSPKKKVKVEEKAAATPEIANSRKLILDQRYREMVEMKENYIEYLTELFFLQSGCNMMDYLHWKKRPTPQLVHFLKSGNLDSDEEDDHGQERKINNEVKVITCSGSNVPLATPVAISTTLPPSVAALNQQGFETRRPGGRHGMVFGHVQPTLAASSPACRPHTPPSSQSVPGTSQATAVPGTSQATAVPGPSQSTAVPGISQPIAGPALAASSHRTSATTISTTTVTTSAVSTSQLQGTKVTDVQPITVHTAHTTKAAHTTPTSSQAPSATRLTKSPPTSPGGTSRLLTRQHQISAVYDGSIGSQEAIVERAKQEAQVMQRVAELRKEGLWSSRRLPKVQEPPRNKSHWDYLLEEMQWLAADFQQERKWKKAAARKVAKMVSRYFQELEQKEIRAEKEEGQKLKRIAGQIAKHVREFWANVEKVVQYKQQTRNEEKRKKALDLHLNFIVDQTEKYSTWLTEGLKKDGSSVVESRTTTPEHSSDGGDDEFEPEADETDDEETIEKAEADEDEKATQAEIDALQKEGEVPLEELLKSLPHEVLSETASLTQDTDDEVDEKDTPENEDDEFTASEEEEIDVEETIEEQEKLDKKVDYSKELADLQNEGDMDMEEIYKKYAGAYDSDFEMPESESGTDYDSCEDSEEDDEYEDSEEEEDQGNDEAEETEDKEEEVGLDYLMAPETPSQEAQAQGDSEVKGPGKDLTDIAAQAQSLQPKGYTLQTTEVKTEVPFLIKHTLREYQHVGLDWLATMYEKRLNGILADEMGLGKTIQTIALLAHLACDKGIWGPHLIVVPTSVMLNWEMEIKKWCPAFKILTYYGNQKERKLKRQGWTKTNAFHVCITSYKLVIQDHQSFRRKKWKYFILDEAQNIKNFKSQRWQTLLNFSSQRRLLLTGTPLQNSLMELWSLMHFLMPNVFQSHREFKEWFANPLTGMIEGSHEYNENLIKRLHKVLRPFLLRRLKCDVEKQMPKKYEHVVMCPLSKRQRFLYDDFMSQGKTKETLASGHFMSVINILMQLRKVCNHPSLFDERPIISPFQTEGLAYRTSSSVLKMLEYDPFKDIDLSLYPGLADMEKDLPAFVAHRVKRLQTPRQLIEEIDEQPDPPPRAKPGKLKPVNFRSISPLSRSVSPLTNQTTTAGATINKTVVSSSRPSTTGATTTPSTTWAMMTTTGATTAPTITATVLQRPLATVTTTTSSITQPPSAMLTSTAVSSVVMTSTPSAVLLSSPAVSSASQAMPQVKVGPMTTAPVTVPVSSGQVATSQPITVQIQQTDQGARLMIPAGQLSQLPAGFIQIVQTSIGQQIIASSVATSSQYRVASPSLTTTSSVSRVTTATSTVVNGLPAITAIAVSATTTPTSVATHVKPSTTVQLPISVATTIARPVMKVSPLVTATTQVKNVVKAVVTTSEDIKSSTSHATRSTGHKVRTKHSPKSELNLDSLCEKREKCRSDKLDYIACTNRRHCERKPVYGEDLRWTVNVIRDMDRTSVRDNTWSGLGNVHCCNVHAWSNPHRPEIFWKQTQVLSNLVHTPLQYLHELEDILSRFVFATPPVVAPCIQMHVPHPPPSSVTTDRWRSFLLHKDLSPKASCLHRISTNRRVQFPELRLIQYDCGKLQTLDLLLRRLKSGDHRVLIFTQMTKMLNILESFLSYHGHRYLRLDGTTRVEQRQFLMDRFNADRRIFCFILSTRSGGIGVNLTGADTVIFYDSDWNPTMDAQAQDRCHRIGQTRDVHIYRLISKKTVEENILKKANQKRMLGDMAIEGGNFTTAFFKENTIQELFSEPSGLESLVEPKVAIEVETKRLGGGDEKSPPPPSDKNIVAQFEQALGKAEDETDVVAADLLKAEQKAELAEFDENIPWDEREAEKRKEEEDMSKAEQELAMLDKELSPIERFAVTFMENEMKPEDDREISEEDIANSKKDWELARLKALKEDEERRLELEEDEMLYTYLRDDTYNQVKKRAAKRAAKKARSNLTSPTRQPANRRSVGRGRGKGLRGRGAAFIDSVNGDDQGEGDIVVDDDAGSEPLLDRLKAARSAMRNLAAKLTDPVVSQKKLPGKNVPTSDEEEKVSKPSPTPKKVTVRQTKAALQKQLKGVKAALKEAASSPQKVTAPKVSTPPRADKKSSLTVQQRLAAQQALQQRLSNATRANAMSKESPVYTSPPTKLPGAASQPQLLSPSQLQHLKQIISKAHHNIKQIPAPGKGSLSLGVPDSAQTTFASHPILQVSQPRPYQIVAPQGPVPQAIRQVLPPGMAAQPLQTLSRGQLLAQTPLRLVSQVPGAQAIHLVSQTPQLGAQGVQLVAQGSQGLPVVTQTQQIFAQAQGLQQMMGGEVSSAQPTISFLKVSGNNTIAQQPMLQYCVNPIGGQGIRLQAASPQLQGANPQQGLVFLQLAGGKAIPVSAGGSPIALPMARMMGNKVIPGATALTTQRIRHIIPSGAIGQHIPVVQNLNLPMPTPRLSMPTSRFQAPKHTAKVSRASLRMMSLAGPTDQVVMNRAPLALLGGLPNSNVVPQPWSNPNLVIRTRRAVMHDHAQNNDVDVCSMASESGSLAPQAIPQAFAIGANPQNPQFISLIKAGASPVIPVGANVTIKEDAIPTTVETVFHPVAATPAIIDGSSTNGMLLYNDNG